MLFIYNTIDENGQETEGTIDALNQDVAITALQNRGLVISSIHPAKQTGLLSTRIEFLERVKNEEVVILSRQIATLFSAQVSALRIFRLLGAENENPKLKDSLLDLARDLQGGSSLAGAMEKHPDIFSDFYVNMVKAGEESGNLEQTFESLASYLERMQELVSKAKNALIYPAFVIFTFIAVMVLMLTLIIPRIAGIIEDAGQEVPIYTKIVIGLSNFLVDYGVFIAIALVVGGFFFVRYARTDEGKKFMSTVKLRMPFFGNLYSKIYLSRLSDNMQTMLGSGIPMVRALEVTASVVDNNIFEEILNEAVEDIKAGKPVSEALGKHEEIPNIMIQMMKVGEETGELKNILQTLSKFYQKEVNNAVDTMVDLIEPAMIVMLGLGVGVLLAAVLMPIYNMSSGF